MSLRVAILTGTETRHRYFVNSVARAAEVVAVGYQDTGYHPADAAAKLADDASAAIVKKHFDERVRQEQLYFGHDGDWLSDGRNCAVRRFDPATLSSAESVAFLQQREAEVVVVYGTTLIKPPLLDRFAGRMINMHLGLSPYYRGTATNFYPLVNEEPQFVGATIHLIDPGIDSGAILHHARPEITADDMPHTLGCKAILRGIEAMIQSLREFESGTITAVPQWSVAHARLYLRKDYHPSQVVRLYELIEDGLFPKYVARASKVRDAFRLVP